MRVAVRMFSLLLVLMVSLGIPVLVAGPVPAVISPKGPGALLLRPTVTGYGPAPCVEKGTVMTIEGSFFGDAPTGKQAVLAGRDFSLVLEGKSWTSKAVAVVVPKDPRLVPGDVYAIGIQDGSGKWISNIDKTFRICLPPPAATQPAGSSAAIVKPPTSTPIKVPAAAPASAGAGAATNTAPPATNRFQPKIATSAEISMTGNRFLPKIATSAEITMTGNRFLPKTATSAEITMTGNRFQPKNATSAEITMTGNGPDVQPAMR